MMTFASSTMMTPTKQNWRMLAASKSIWMLAGIMRIGLQIADRNIFDSTRLYGAADFSIDVFNLANAVTCASLHVSTMIDTTEIVFRLIAQAHFYGARTGDLRLGGCRVPKRRSDFPRGMPQLS